MHVVTLSGRAIDYMSSQHIGMAKLHQITVNTGGGEDQPTYDDSQDHYWMYKAPGDLHVSGLLSKNKIIDGV